MQALSVELTYTLVRVGAVLIAMLVIALAFRRWRRSVERDAQRMFEQLDLIRGELLSVAERMQAYEAHKPAAVPVERSPVEVRAPQPHTGPRGYEVATRLARGGASCEELISSCGLSRHEAELLLRLHGAQAAPNKKPVVAAAPERRSRLAAVV